MDLFAFIYALDPTKVMVVESKQEVDEPWLLDITVGHTVPVLPVAPDRADNELEASVERLFNEGGSGTQTKQGDSARGGPNTEIQLVVGAADTIAEEPALEDHGIPSGTSVDGIPSGTSVDAEVEVTAIPTLPFVVAYVSTTLEHEDEDHTDSMAGPNLHTIGAPSSTPVMTTATAVTSMVDSTLVAKEKTISLSVEVKMRAEYNVKEKRRLKYVVKEKDELLEARDEEIENLKARILLKEVKAAEAIPLCAEASNFETVKKSLRDEVNALKEHNTILKKEWNALDLTSVKSQNDALVDRVHELELYSFRLQEKVTLSVNLSRKVCMTGYLLGLHMARKLQNVNFPLFTELRSNKDASIKAVMNVLHKVVIGPTALSLALDVSSIEATSDVVPATADTTTALSTTFTSASTIAPISVDDYEIIGKDDQADADGNA
nr:hypothetical protein [Tanacetum cinerariifolium]